MQRLFAVILVMVSIENAYAESQYGQHKLLPEGGAAEDFFGFDVALHEDTALVGSFKSDDVVGADVGSAYVYTRTKQGWHEQAKLMASDGASGDTFGGKVAIHRNMAVIGAIRHDAKGEDSGAAYVFNRSGSSWSQQAKLTAEDGNAGDAFGQSIAVSDDTIVIGAPHDDDHGSSSGAVYVFSNNGNAWTQQAKLTASDGAPGDVFGISVALDGDDLLIGADLHDAKAPDAGAAYVFVRNDNTWQQQAKLMADDGGETDIFGVRVALSGDTALISARRDDDDTMGVDAGSAYVFVRRGTDWFEQAKLTAEDGAADDRFGRGVAIWNDRSVISAMHQDDQGTDSGAVYVFTRAGDAWQQQNKFTAKDGAPGDLFGWGVAMDKHTILIGATRHDKQGKESGAAYIIEIENK